MAADGVAAARAAPGAPAASLSPPPWETARSGRPAALVPLGQLTAADRSECGGRGAGDPSVRATASGLQRPLAAVAVRTGLLLLQLYTLAAPLGLVLASRYVAAHRQTSAERLLAAGSGLPFVGAARDPAQFGRFLVAALDATRPETVRQVALLVAATSVVILWDRSRAAGSLWQAILLGIGGLVAVAVTRDFGLAPPERAAAEMVVLPLAAPPLLLMVWVAGRSASWAGARLLRAIRGSAARRADGGHWQRARSGATMGIPGVLPPAAEAVRADRVIDAKKGADAHGRQESQEHGEEGRAEEGGQKEVALP